MGTCTFWMTGIGLAGSTVGIVGHRADRRGRGGACKALAARFTLDAGPAKRTQRKRRPSYRTLDDLLAESDIVTLHCPLTAERAPPDRRGGAGQDEAHGLAHQHQPWSRGGPGGALCRAGRRHHRRRRPGCDDARAAADSTIRCSACPTAWCCPTSAAPRWRRASAGYHRRRQPYRRCFGPTAALCACDLTVTLSDNNHPAHLDNRSCRHRKRAGISGYL